MKDAGFPTREIGGVLRVVYAPCIDQRTCQVALWQIVFSFSESLSTSFELFPIEQGLSPPGYN